MVDPSLTITSLRSLIVSYIANDKHRSYIIFKLSDSSQTSSSSSSSSVATVATASSSIPSSLSTTTTTTTTATSSTTISSPSLSPSMPSTSLFPATSSFTSEMVRCELSIQQLLGYLSLLLPHIDYSFATNLFKQLQRQPTSKYVLHYHYHYHF